MLAAADDCDSASDRLVAKTTMMRRALLAALAAAAVTADEVGPGPVIPDPAWDDTACHEPVKRAVTDRHCHWCVGRWSPSSTRAKTA